MPGDTCVFCGNTRQKDPSVSMHQFPQDPKLRSEWIKALELDDRAIKSHHRLCSRHFPQGNRNNIPNSSLEKHFASPKKCWTSRAKRAKNREVKKNLFGQLSSNSQGSTIEMPSSSTNQGASSQGMAVQEHQETTPLLAPVGEQLRTDYQLHDLPTSKEDEEAHVLLNTGLLARIEALEYENRELKAKLLQATNASSPFTATNFAGNDDLIRVYQASHHMKLSYLAEDIKRGCSIGSLRIHVERAIGRIKNFAILKGKFPLSMIWLLNQVVCVCAWLTNFQPVLVPPPMEASDEEITEYFQNLEEDSDITDHESDVE